MTLRGRTWQRCRFCGCVFADERVVRCPSCRQDGVELLPPPEQRRRERMGKLPDAAFEGLPQTFNAPYLEDERVWPYSPSSFARRALEKDKP